MNRRPAHAHTYAHAPARAAAITAAVLVTGGLLAGCGSKYADSGSDTGSSPTLAAASPASSVPSAQQSWEQQQAAALAAHDRAFPEVAKACAGRSTAQPTASPSASAHANPDPENPKYAENHGYLQTAPLNPAQQCRGEAHAARITAALAKGAPKDRDGARSLLTGLGYSDVTLTPSGTVIGFTLSVPGVGPCLTGALSTAPKIDVHGMYLEGGCDRPQGGH